MNNGQDVSRSHRKLIPHESSRSWLHYNTCVHIYIIMYTYIYIIYINIILYTYIYILFVLHLIFCTFYCQQEFAVVGHHSHPFPSHCCNHWQKKTGCWNGVPFQPHSWDPGDLLVLHVPVLFLFQLCTGGFAVLKLPGADGWMDCSTQIVYTDWAIHVQISVFIKCNRHFSEQNTKIKNVEYEILYVM